MDHNNIKDLERFEVKESEIQEFMRDNEVNSRKSAEGLLKVIDKVFNDTDITVSIEGVDICFNVEDNTLYIGPRKEGNAKPVKKT